MKRIMLSFIIGIGLVVVLSVPVFAESLEERVAELEQRVAALEALLGVEGTDTDSVVTNFATDEENALSGIYSPDYFTGYKFSEDGTVLYYDAKWYKEKDKPTGCKPEYQYGTYILDGTALTIKISGQDEEVTGVVTNDMIVIDGEECMIRTESYGSDYEQGADIYSKEAIKDNLVEWNGLNEKLGLDIVEYKEN